MRFSSKFERLNFFTKFGDDNLYNEWITSTKFYQKIKSKVGVVKIRFICSFSTVKILDDYLTHFQFDFFYEFCGDFVKKISHSNLKLDLVGQNWM